jgi:hypothetical protein
MLQVNAPAGEQAKKHDFEAFLSQNSPFSARKTEDFGPDLPGA